MGRNLVRYLLFALVVVATLFPVVLLAEWGPGLGDLFHAILPDRQAHNVGHVILFLIVGVLLQLLFQDLHKRFALYFGVMLLIVVVQEVLQLPAKHEAVSLDDLNDLALDLVGAVLGFLLFGWVRRLRARANASRLDLR